MKEVYKKAGGFSVFRDSFLFLSALPPLPEIFLEKGKEGRGGNGLELLLRMVPPITGEDIAEIPFFPLMHRLLGDTDIS